MAIEDIESKLGYVFKDKSLINTALTHTSYANERHNGKGHLYSNERLEFVGDSVVGMIVARYLFETHPDWEEGELSKIRASVVCEEALAKLGTHIDIPKNLKLGVGEKQTNGRNKPSIVSDAMESVVAAVLLDSDFETTKSIFLPFFKDLLANVSEDVMMKDCKTRLQEMAGDFKFTPQYSIIKSEGPAHMRIFTAEVRAGELRAEGTGKTKREAEQMAAGKIIEILEEKND